MSDLPPNLSGGVPWATPNDVNMVRQFALSNSAASGSPGILRQTFGGGTIYKRIERIKRRGGGLNIRVLEAGISIATGPGTEPSTADYKTALQNCYVAQELTPTRGDLVSLRYSGGSRLIARFFILEDDQAATNATVMFEFPPDGPSEDRVEFYGLNMSYAPVEQIVQSLEDYLAGANGGQEPDGRDIEPASEGSFAISVAGIYDTSPEGFLVPPIIGIPSIDVLGGTVKPSDDYTATVSAVSGINDYAFPAADGVSFVHIYLKVTIALGGAGGTMSSVIATIEHRASSSDGVAAVSQTSYVSGNAIRYFTIGTVALAKRGNRRYARITQVLVGNLTEFPEGTGANAPDANGVVRAAGVRKFTIVVNGKLYEASWITGPLLPVT